MALTKITGKDFKEAVDWLWDNRQNGGCYSKVLATTSEGTKLCFVVGWGNGRDYGDDEKKYGYFDDGYCISAKIGYQHRNNAMQTDYDWDFNMPYDTETGDVWDTSAYVPRDADWDSEANDYNREAEKIWAAYGDPDDKSFADDTPAPLDIMESKKKEAKKHTSSMQKKKESLAKKNEAFTLPRDVADAMKLVKSFLEKNKDAIADEQLVSDADAAVEYQLELTLNVLSDLVANAPKSESKKSEGVYGTIRVDSEDIAIKVQESHEYPSASGRSLTVEVPQVEAWFSTLSEFSDCIDGLAENCNGYPDISRDGSDILVQINAPKEDESDDYEVIVELRCSTEITSTSLEGVVDLLNHD